MTALRVEHLPWPGDTPPVEAEIAERLRADGFEPSRWSDAPGATYTPHTHDHDESLWVLEGRIDFLIGGRTYELVAGDRLQLPAGTVHAAEAGPAGATYLIGERG